MKGRNWICRLAAFAAVMVMVIGPPSTSAADAVPGELIVKYRPGVDAARRARVEAALPSLVRVRTFDFIGAQHWRVSGMSSTDALAMLRASPDVAYAEPNEYVYADTIPNDPSFGLLWGLRNTGQGGGYAGDDIKATQAWDLFRGDPSLRIGVLDTGIDYTHPDLAANVWTNPGEIAGNGRDDDGNGYVDDVHGYDFVNLDGEPRFAPMRPERVYRIRDRLHERLPGLPLGWSPHWLRHTHATALLPAGVPLHVVSRRLGHADVQTTMDLYGWVTEDAELRAVAGWRSFTEGWRVTGA